MTDRSNYKEIKTILDDRPTGIIKTAYEKPDGSYILRVEYKGQVEWIEMEDWVEFHDKERDWTFQQTFRISDAIEYGYQMPCNSGIEVNGFKNLTCDPTTLKLVEVLEDMSKGMGHHQSKKIKICPKCQQKWRIISEYDSHRGTDIVCYKC